MRVLTHSQRSPDDVSSQVPSPAVDSLAMPRMGDLVLRYVADRAARAEILPATVISYRECLWLFAEVVGIDRPPAKVTRRHVELFLAGKTARATKRGRLSIIRTFFEWCILNGHVRKNPTAGIQAVRVPRSIPRALKPAQVAAALIAAKDSRERAIILLMAQEMLRAMEVAGLELGDIDFDDRLLIVRHGKGGHQRVLPVSDETLSAIRVYLGEHPARSGFLIRSYLDPAAPLRSRYLAALVSDAMHRAGIDESGHALRHSGASDMLDRGANIRQVQIALGHASLGTTQRYLRWSDGRDLRDAMGGRRYGA